MTNLDNKNKQIYYKNRELRKKQMRKVYMRRRIIALLIFALIIFLAYKGVRYLFRDLTLGNSEFTVQHQLTGANKNNPKSNSNTLSGDSQKTDITSGGQKIKLTSKKLSTILGGGKITEDLKLINADNLLPSGYEPKLVLYSDNIYVSPQVKTAFQEMLKDTMAKTGDMIYIISGFRDRKKQTNLKKKDELYTQVPGGSEHESGLAIDIMVGDIGDERFAETPAGKFTNENSWKYGFIVRYGKNKQSITTIPFEPWHFRYVGLPHAKIMYENDLAMEEYINKIKEWEYFTYGDYIISMQAITTDNTYKVPDGFKVDSVSESIQGYYIFTFSKNNI